jgi:hypothetical protein
MSCRRPPVPSVAVATADLAFLEDVRTILASD